eukprot:GDKI01042956.1.p1 GENE.GDKI01042956.1~~GDKI01042956.1.p1  ORF type:complete len:196 (+),score=35.08 GDKI01042956.1:127-714(+)
MDRRTTTRPNTQTTSILDRSLVKGRTDVSLSLFAFLFSEMVQYAQSTAAGGSLEDKLHEMGTRVGYRVLDLVCFREKPNRRETKLLQMLNIISNNVWKTLFGHPGDLLRSANNENEYMINDKNMLLNRYISVPRDLEHINCAAYAAGIVEGILHSAEFPAEVTAHTVQDNPTDKKSTTILIRFLPEVMQREKKQG